MIDLVIIILMFCFVLILMCLSVANKFISCIKSGFVPFAEVE